MDIAAWRREDPELTRAVTQIHEPGALPVDAGIPARHAYGELLPGDVRARLLEKAGRCLTWWAGPDAEGRPYAVVVGDRGLCRVGQVQQGEPAEYRGQRARVEPGSLRSRTFDGRSAPEGRAVAPGLPGAPGLRLDLVPEAQGVLGHSPLPVQDFLRRPFAGGGAPRHRRLVLRRDRRARAHHLVRRPRPVHRRCSGARREHPHPGPRRPPGPGRVARDPVPPGPPRPALIPGPAPPRGRGGPRFADGVDPPAAVR